MSVPGPVSSIAAGIVASRVRPVALQGARCGPMGAGRDHADLTMQERHRLRALLAWAHQHKSQAAFTRLYAGSEPGGTYGVWSWQRTGARLVLTAMPRAQMIEIYQGQGNELKVAFVWNNVLREWNDVLLPLHAGRGFFALALGVRTGKTEGELVQQRRRIYFKRLFRRWWRLREKWGGPR